MTKSLFKKCLNQKCKFDRCWIKAPRCEKCGYDFNLKRMPRKPKPIVLPDEDEPLPPPPPVVDTHKTCPNCSNRCWHKAKFCEKCQYDFITGEAKKDVQSEIVYVAKEERSFIGYRPVFASIEAQPWMDDFVGPSTNLEGLRHWAENFLRQITRFLASAISQADFSVCSDCVVDWAEGYAKNPHIREAKDVLYGWYGRKTGVTQWVQVTEAVKKGWLLTSEETSVTYRDIENGWRAKIAVDMTCTHVDGRPFTYTSLMPAEDVPAFREKAAKKGHRYLAYGDKQHRSLRLLPPEWNDMDDAAQVRWAHRFGLPSEPFPKRMTKKVKS